MTTHVHIDMVEDGDGSDDIAISMRLQGTILTKEGVGQFLPELLAALQDFTVLNGDEEEDSDG